jgi:hypothetical protein
LFLRRAGPSRAAPTPSPLNTIILSLARKLCDAPSC